MNIYPYVYKLTHPIAASLTGEFYIGYRSANKVPAEEDLGFHYFTSSQVIKPRFHEFRSQVIAEFFEEDAAKYYETGLIVETLNDPLLRNRVVWYKGKALRSRYGVDVKLPPKSKKPGWTARRKWWKEAIASLMVEEGISLTAATREVKWRTRHPVKAEKVLPPAPPEMLIPCYDVDDW